MNAYTAPAIFMFASWMETETTGQAFVSYVLQVAGVAFAIYSFRLKVKLDSLAIEWMAATSYSSLIESTPPPVMEV